MSKVERISISKYINTKFRQFAIYTLESRGIPNFYDSLTNGQRIAIIHAPSKFEKTPTLSGACIASGAYHHNPQILEKTISRLARPFCKSHHILEGYGNFGSQVTPQAAAARYTEVKINSDIKEIISSFSYLNTRSDEGDFNPLNITMPVGLALPIIGIAVGYRTMILPRKLSDIERYLKGSIKKCTPYFDDYPKDLMENVDGNTWLFKSTIEPDISVRTIRITNLPPILSYSSFIQKLDKAIDSSQKCYSESFSVEIINNSKSAIDITLKIKGFKNNETFDSIVEYIKKITSIVVQEKIVFIKDGKVLQYANIEDYLTDFKNKNEEVLLESQKWLLNKTRADIEFENAKLLFLQFMYGYKRTTEEIKKFFGKYKSDITTRLDNIKARNINAEQIVETEEFIKLLKSSEVHVIKQVQLRQDIVDALPKELHTIIDNTVYDEAFEEIDGVEVFQDEDYDIEQNEVE